MAEATPNPKTVLTLGLCFLAAVVEGMDNVSMGLAAPKLGAELGLAPAQVGMALSASILGLMIGALVGGRLADRFGRKRVLMCSVLALGLFSLATVLSRDLAMLIPIRFMVGLGLGGAFPILIAIGAEAVPPRFRATGVALIYIGNPLGAALISLIVGLGGADMDWRTIFYIGGVSPLVLVPLLALFLPEPAGFRAARAAVGAALRPSGIGQILFGHGRAATTLLLWGSCLFTLFILYLMLNWIPSLMVAKGLSRPQGAMVGMVLNLGAAAGSLVFGVAVDRGYRRQTIMGAYVALALSLSGLAYLSGYPAMLLFGLLVGFFLLGVQTVLYALSAEYYPTLDRGTGVGASVAVGRIGSIAAPLVGGLVLSAGYGANVVLATAIPCGIVAAVCALVLIVRPSAEETAALSPA